jgi:hypothetical protein
MTARRLSLLYNEWIVALRWRGEVTVAASRRRDDDGCFSVTTKGGAVVVVSRLSEMVVALRRWKALAS